MPHSRHTGTFRRFSAAAFLVTRSEEPAFGISAPLRTAPDDGVANVVPTLAATRIAQKVRMTVPPLTNGLSASFVRRHALWVCDKDHNASPLNGPIERGGWSGPARHWRGRRDPIRKRSSAQNRIPNKQARPAPSTLRCSPDKATALNHVDQYDLENSRYGITTEILPTVLPVSLARWASASWSSG